MWFDGPDAYKAGIIIIAVVALGIFWIRNSHRS